MCVCERERKRLGVGGGGGVKVMVCSFLIPLTFGFKAYNHMEGFSNTDNPGMGCVTYVAECCKISHLLCVSHRNIGED